MWIHTSDSSIKDSQCFHCVAPPSSFILQPSGCDLQNVNWVVGSSARSSQDVALFPVAHRWLSASVLKQSAGGCAAQGSKVNLHLFEVGLQPHWLSLSSLTTFFIYSRCLRLLHSHAHSRALNCDSSFLGSGSGFLLCAAPLSSALKGWGDFGGSCRVQSSHLTASESGVVDFQPVGSNKEWTSLALTLKWCLSKRLNQSASWL